jgi:ECF sigma factor
VLRKDISPTPEVAEHLEVSVRTVESDWTHARARLKRELSGGAQATARRSSADAVAGSLLPMTLTSPCRGHAEFMK